MVLWTAVFLFGPTALWLSVLWFALYFLHSWRRVPTTAARWGLARQFVLELAIVTLSYLVGFQSISRIGGANTSPRIGA